MEVCVINDESPKSFSLFERLRKNSAAQVTAILLAAAGCSSGYKDINDAPDGGYPAEIKDGGGKPDASIPAADAGSFTDAGGATDAGRPDRDGDFIPDDQDPCPDDRDNRCRTITDNDFDGVDDNRDNCPPPSTDPKSIFAAYNPDQIDTDGDGYGNPCDCEAENSDIHPGASRVKCNGISEDCSEIGLLSYETADGTAVFAGEPDCACRPGKILPVVPGVKGECTTGFKRCETILDANGNVVGSAFSVIQMPVGPAPELCDDDLDNNCDGLIDNGCSCVALTSKPCGLTLGTCAPGGVQVCDPAGEWTNCIGEPHPAPELCDDLDNDCDGKTDNNINGRDRGETCRGQHGICRTDGLYECNANGSLICSKDSGGSESPATVELCDGKDNDCDGETDEGCGCRAGEAAPCGIHAGECRQGVKICQNGAWGDCGGPALVGPSAERCNGLDDNCDNRTDEEDVCNPNIQDAGPPPIRDAGAPPISDAGSPPLYDAGQPPQARDAGTQSSFDAGSLPPFPPFPPPPPPPPPP